ncbi:MAG TPA: PQQ-binding-like beta-propeller repeat protein, partial [Blastocatellia bacterium]|nr:PQQ-binding-like beta-propeller repeat protein [Blastocatellia bacterium]
MTKSRFNYAILFPLGVILLAAFFLTPSRNVSASDPGSGDWPMWGGTPDRNMISNMKGLPETWDINKKTNVKWVAALGSQSYGNPVVAGGQVYVGTNNEGLRDPKQGGDRGVLMVFDEKTGEFLWQMTSEKLAAGRVNDWPYQGVCSSPLVEGDRLYVHFGHYGMACLDLRGSIVWRNTSLVYEPVHGSGGSPILVDEKLIFSCDGASDPFVIALDKATGKVLWKT